MSSNPQRTHSLAFRVMRLCNPSFHVEPQLRLDPADLFVGEDMFDDPLVASNLSSLLSTHLSKSTDSSDISFADRYFLQHPSDAMGLWASPASSFSPNPSGRFTWERHSAAILASIKAQILKLGTLL
ncbi:uncharacterized protein LOC120127818 [Hibiscus syriacus]|uniref:uncharacterized protein LOC120127818 n=1 Tax=Hibiscus syriacus TaxID=106335 RepID=UPI0019243234|nr:uncharacterized protein LOC120127818 [Hibiscus syriacus]